MAGVERSASGPDGARRRCVPHGTLSSPEERRRFLGSVFPLEEGARHWWFRFAVMLSLSVVVAVMGLSSNSVAMVIGAMLIAPLMAPLVGLSAALVMAWPRRLLQSASAVAIGSVGAVGLSWALTLLLPSSERTLTPEVLSRVSPDLRDLLVALAAGAAGAYAEARDDVSSALPGVAVAVALIPPLAVAGYTLAIGRTDLTGGALLLYGANLVAIVLAGAVVLLAAGFVPQGRLKAASLRIRLGLALVLAATLAVVVPLSVATLAKARGAKRTEDVNRAVLAWLSPYPGLEVSSVFVAGKRVTVDVVGSVPPPPSQTLSRALTGILGANAGVRVRWFESS